MVENLLITAFFKSRPSVNRGRLTTHPQQADSCASRRTTEDSQCACIGTTRQFSFQRLRILRVEGRFLCESRHKTEDGWNDHMSTTNAPRLRLPAPVAWYRKSTAFPACEKVAHDLASVRERIRRNSGFTFHSGQRFSASFLKNRVSWGLIQLRVSFSGHLVEEGCAEPSSENDGGACDEIADIHQMIRES